MYVSMELCKYHISLRKGMFIANVLFLITIDLKRVVNMFLDQQGNIVHNCDIVNANIIMYGASSRNKRVINELNIEDKVQFVLDNDVNKKGKHIDGFEIRGFEEITKNKESIILSVLSEHAAEIVRIVHKHGNNKCIFYLERTINTTIIKKQNKNCINLNNRHYKYIHVFPNLIFFKIFYSLVEKEFNIEEHLFIVDWAEEDLFDISVFINKKAENNNNIMVIDDVYMPTGLFSDEKNSNSIFLSKKMNTIVKNAEKIILHSAFFKNEGQKIIKYMLELNREKMIWICWGGDSMFDRNCMIVTNILKKIKYIYASKPRMKILEEIYGKVIKCMESNYNYFEKTERKKEEKKEGIHILLGHSAANYGNHIQGLYLLEKYKNENILIYCPLSYGDKTYAEHVICEGKKIFGERFIPTLKTMEYTQYYHFLEKVDVAIFPMTRQAGGTTITYLNALGIMIYLNYSVKQCYDTLNVHSEDIENIEHLSFSDFCKNSRCNENVTGNIQKLNEKNILGWKKILEIQ